MLPPSGRPPPIPQRRLHLTRDFPYSYSLLSQRLLGQGRALDALGPFEPTSDDYVLGQLARENRRRDNRIQLVETNLVHHIDDRNMLWKLICERETDQEQRDKLFVMIVWALAIIRGRIETGPKRIEGEQTLADIGRNTQRLKSSLSRASQAVKQIKTSAAEHRAYRRDLLLQLIPSDAFFGEDQDKFIRLLEATAEHRFFQTLYATGDHVSEDPEARFNDVFQAGVGDLALLIEGLLGVKRNERIARLSTLSLNGIAIQTMPRRTWRGGISDRQIITWRERAAENRARETPLMTRALRALGLTLR
jgi:hypothetical protein